jgi:UDP-N-acetylmuramate: L-alanyl-gamma-D-glutamyl-meso-diaminopimelate ligase
VKAHLSGIAGTAMASLAGLLKAAGHSVTGSDQDVYPPMSTELQALGISVLTPYSASNVPTDADLVVVGNALSRGNPEVEAVLDRRQRMTSLPALLATEFLYPRRPLVVAGTHGKTTTTSLLAFLLRDAGLDPSYLVGGVPHDLGRSFHLGAGEHFVIEGDEYDSAFFDKRPKFVHYLPELAIVGNVEFDHADIYPDLAAVQKAFERLFSVVPRKGSLVAGIESEALAAILDKAPCPVTSFAIGAEADYRAEDVRPSGEGTEFSLLVRGQDQGTCRLALAGEHNVRNALAALAAARWAGVPLARAKAALPRFRGVKRRLELLGEARGVRLYDDFAHHPTAVRETLKALLPRRRKRLVAVFEPRSFTSRTRVFEEEFARAFVLADLVVVSSAFRKEKVPEGARLSESSLVDAISELGGRALFLPGVEDIVSALDRALSEGDDVVLLSNGGFGGIGPRLLAALGASA